MENKYTSSEIKAMIEKILTVLEQNFKSNNKNKIKYDEIALFIQDLNDLFEIYSTMDVKDCGKTIITRYIKLIDLLISHP